MRRTWLLAAALIAAHPAIAAAQPADVPALSKLIENQPADMDRSAWKEKRREAARKLATSKDKRAVPTLIKLAETETFDIIGEIAIEGLGNLGDPSAAPVLRKISTDNTRDKQARDLAKKALAKLPAGGATTGGGTTSTGGSTTTAGGATTGGGTTGGSTVGGATVGGGATGGGTTAGGTTGDAGGGEVSGGGEVGGETGETGVVDGNATVGRNNTLLGEPRATAGIPTGPALPDDTLAAYDRLTFGAGAASVGYDTVRKRPAFDIDVQGRFAKRVEREKIAWGYDAGAHVVAGYVSPPGSEKTRGAQVVIDGGGEARFYSGKIYGVGKAVAGVQVNYIAVEDDGGNSFKDTRTYADFQVALGGGYGRLLDVGGAIRVRRLARTLDAARALGKQIDATTARRLQLAWWSLRGERSSYEALVATVAILREAGILLGEPDAGLTYELLTVLRDSQLFLRPSGMDLQLTFGEGYLKREEMDPTPNESGRVETLLVSAGYGQQIQDDKAEISGTAYARLRLFAPETQPAPWAIGATGRFRTFAYGEHGDPLGAFDVSATVRLSDDSCVGMDCESATASRIEGQVGFTLWLNQASGVRLAGAVAQDGGELFIGAQLSATYGLLDATFAGF
ncbi:MAG: hypothetical protein JWP01_4076 [Myxococcales bacterium]|nr:hypothetical protein [Myxococcales bacterium]